MTSGQINCPAPLPEGPADSHLTRLLVPAPYVVLEKKATEKATGTQKSARNMVVSDSSSDESETPSFGENEEQEEENSPPQRREERRGRPPQRGRPRGLGKGRPLRRTMPPTPKRAKRSGQTGPSVRRNRKFGYQNNS